MEPQNWPNKVPLHHAMYVDMVFHGHVDLNISKYDDAPCPSARDHLYIPPPILEPGSTLGNSHLGLGPSLSITVGSQGLRHTSSGRADILSDSARLE